MQLAFTLINRKTIRWIVLTIFSLLSYNLLSQEITYGFPFDVTRGISSENSTSTLTDPEGLVLSNDGLKLFVLDGPGDQISQYTVTEPFDISSGLILDGSYSVSSEESLPLGLSFNDDGSKMYIIGAIGKDVNQYSLTTPFSITSGVSLDGNSTSLSSEESAPTGIAFNNDGSKMYIVGLNTGAANQYSLTSAFDVTAGITFDGSAFDLSGEETAPEDIKFNTNGSKMFIVGSNGDEVNQYSLTTPFDITSGVSSDGSALELSGKDGDLNGLFFNETGNEIFLVGQENDQVYELTLDVGGFIESGLNDGSVDGSLVISITGDTFTSAGSTLTETTDYAIANLPSGLTPSITVEADGLSATLTLSGNAVDNFDSNDIDNLLFTFYNSAFDSNDASSIANAVGADSNIPIDFFGSPKITFGDTYNFLDEYATLETYDLDASLLHDLAFSSDGLKLFIIDDTDDEVDQYTLASAFDISSEIIFDGVFSVSSEETSPTGLAFSVDGKKMFITGTNGDEINQYTLSSPFDILAGVSFDHAYSVASREAAVTGITFSSDGQTLFIVGSSGREVNQFSLSTAFDISSTVTYQGIYSVSSQEVSPQALAFKHDGTEMYVLGSSGNDVSIYNLTNPFSITSGVSFSGNTFNTDDGIPTGIAFNVDGTKMFILGESADDVLQYNLPAAVVSESTSNDGSVDDTFIIELEGDTFTSTGNTLTLDIDYTVSGLPFGLTPVLTVSGDGTFITFSFEGNALVNNIEAEESITLEFSFNNSAFSTFSASEVDNAIGEKSLLHINFEDNPFITYGNRYIIDEGLTLEGSLNVLSQESQIRDLRFNDDGTKLFIIGSTGDDVNEYSITEPFDLTGDVTFIDNYSISSRENNPTGFAFGTSPLGIHFMAVIGTGGDDINTYRLTGEDDISTTSLYSATTFSVSVYESSPEGIVFNQDGTKMFIVGSGGDEVNEFELSSEFQPNTASYEGAFRINSELDSPRGLCFSADGTNMFVVGSDFENATTHYQIHQYSLSVPFSVTSGDVTYNGIEYDLTNELSDLTGMTFNNDGSKLYVSANAGDWINQYAVNKGGFVESDLNDGSVDGQLNFAISGDTFTNAGSTLTEGLHYIITNMPSGMSPSISVASDGKSATLTLSGMASSHADANDIASLQFSFENSAFTNSNASIVLQAINGESNVGIDFEDNFSSWTGTTSSDWNTSSNWSSNAVPTEANDVMILSSANNPIISDDQSVNNITIESGASLVVSSGAAFAIFGSVTNDGTFTIEREMIGGTGEGIPNTAGLSILSHPFSSPMTLSNLTDADFLFTYTNGSGYSSNLLGESISIDAGTGFFAGYDESSYTVSLSGTPNSGDVTYSVSQSGYELIGNPYTAPIDAAAFISDNVSLISGGLYLWDDGNENVGASRGGDYINITRLGTTEIEQPDNTDDGVSGGQGVLSGATSKYISSTQGFFAGVAGSGTLTFNTGQIVTASGANTHFYRLVEEKRKKIKLGIKGNELYNEVIIGLVEEASYGVDRLYDAEKFNTSYPLAFYSLIGENRYAQQAIPTYATSVNLGFDIDEIGEYELIKVYEENLEEYSMKIVDHWTGQTYDLSKTSAVPFSITSVAENDQRFELVFAPLEVLSTSKDVQELKVYGNQSQLNLDYPSVSKEEVVIYQINGQKIFGELVHFQNGHAQIAINLKSNQLYIVRVKDREIKFIVK